MQVGYPRVIKKTCYPYTRNIVKKVHGVTYVPFINGRYLLFAILRVLRKAHFYKNIRIESYLENSFSPPWNKAISIYHLFNGIVVSNKIPWITTFETQIPRLLNVDNNELQTDKLFNKSLNYLANPNCKQIIAISENAKEIELDILKKFPIVANQITAKICVIAPPQKVLIDATKKRNRSEQTLRFLFVGSDFFRKGGDICLTALGQLRRLYSFPIELTIVSSLHYNDYASHATKMDAMNFERLIKQNRSWVKYFNYIPNSKVLSLMTQADIGLLPTLDDTYGFSVLEMQASGVPVITTDVRALSEINNEEQGWIIHVPTKQHKRINYLDANVVRKTKIIIENDLVAIVTHIFQNRAEIETKRNAAIKSIEREHDPKNYEMKLREIYNIAIG